MAGKRNISTRGRKAARTSLVIFCVVVVAVNTNILFRASQQHGWDALRLLMLVGPVFNGCCMAVGSVIAWLAGRLRGNGVSGAYWLLAFLLPTLGIVAGLFAAAFTGGGC